MIDDDQEERLNRGDVERQKCPHGEKQIEPRQSHDQLAAAHEESIQPSAVKARGRPQRQAQAERQERRQQPREQRHPPAV